MNSINKARLKIKERVLRQIEEARLMRLNSQSAGRIAPKRATRANRRSRDD